ncbi:MULTISPECIES: GNAT family N-acetyltransferase [Myroides]|uniref:GNAT family N-acetyltransferase n=1 Tax=Myroides albus TaxID=2562892 RepID=A0A6I3LFV8_9FLAO|nr:MULTISPECIES: GNAT family N-acetyltransferase [Myroides]MTG96684.1 GNAT family N-acetyltransferase [Myroides albus]MVX34696.1 GNAT family N-acetyltransferase [Myroides sp. LoEW2-1]UVD80904.1 GNAT family N-acetyltransferase [Myroides albus]
MLNIIRTDATNEDFINLTKELDDYLKTTDGDEHDFFDQYNKLDQINHVIIIYFDNIAIGCGAIKPYDQHTIEIKRMYTKPNARGKGVASTILTELEKWSKALGYSRCILEMGKRQTQAEILYRKNNYTLIPNYGQYQEIESSICFEKTL